MESKDSVMKKRSQMIEKEFDDQETYEKMTVFLHKLEERYSGLIAGIFRPAVL